MSYCRVQISEPAVEVCAAPRPAQRNAGPEDQMHLPRYQDAPCIPADSAGSPAASVGDNVVDYLKKLPPKILSKIVFLRHLA